MLRYREPHGVWVTGFSPAKILWPGVPVIYSLDVAPKWAGVGKLGCLGAGAGEPVSTRNPFPGTPGCTGVCLGASVWGPPSGPVCLEPCLGSDWVSGTVSGTGFWDRCVEQVSCCYAKYHKLAFWFLLPTPPASPPPTTSTPSPPPTTSPRLRRCSISFHQVPAVQS